MRYTEMTTAKVFIWQWQNDNGRWHELNSEWENEEIARANVPLVAGAPRRLIERTITDKVLA